MTISDKARKILWGRSGNQCAICKHELVIDATANDADSVVGEECHIISERERGPRHDPSYPQEKLDSCDNLILLCRIHHKMVDDQEDTYTADILRQMKSNHEVSIAQKLKAGASTRALRIRRVRDNIPAYLSRLMTGKQVLDVVGNACAGSANHEELHSQVEVDLVGGFLQSAYEWGEMWADLEPAAQVNASFQLSQALQELEQAGFLVFGSREVQFLEGGDQETAVPWPVAILWVLRKDNESVADLNADRANRYSSQQQPKHD
jgi:hypothetical protein